MKQTQFAIALMFLPLLAACSRDLMEKDTEPVEGKMLIATLEGGKDTKTYLAGPEDGIYYPFWSSTDQLAVYPDNLSKPDKYSLVEGAGTARASFKGIVGGKQLVGLYPYSFIAPEGLSDNVLTLALPEKQYYAPGTFGDNTFPMLAVGAPSDLTFMNLCAVLKLSLTGESTVSSIVFTAADPAMSVSGKATVRTDYTTSPELAMAQGGSPSVTLICGSVQLDPQIPTDFFIVLPAGTYKGGFTVQVKTFTGDVTKTAKADITFQRSQLRAIPVFEASTDGEIDPDHLPYNQIWYKTTDRSYTYIDSQAFDAQLESHTYDEEWGVLTFDGPVTAVGNMESWAQAFGSYLITDVRLPDCVKTIGPNAFAGTSMTSFRTPASLEEVGPHAFASNCLTRIYGDWASEDEKALILSNGTLVAYAMGALDPDLVIPDGVTSIAAYLFWGVETLETVTLPSSVTGIDYGVFFRCPSLREFKGSSSLIYDSRSLVVPSGDLAAVAGCGLTDYICPENITLDTSVFEGMTELKTFTFPNSLRSFWYGSSSWSGCENLEFFYGPGTTEDHHGFFKTYSDTGCALFYLTPVCPVDYRPMGLDAIISMSGNKCIERLTLEDKVALIEGEAFSFMENLRYLRLSSGVTSLGSNTFRNCMHLDSLFVRSYSPPTYSEEPVAHFGHSGLRIFVPEGYEDLYKSAPGWSNYAQYIEGYWYDDLEEVDYYISGDYSQDGKVTTLQEASEGAGIELVLMGDAFSDRQIADGTYDTVMEKMMEAFFGEEPYTSYRSLFNVHSVKVVSATEGYEHGGQTLGGYFGDGTQVGGNDQLCMQYALKVVPEEKMDNTLIIVAMNSTAYAGTCWMYYPNAGDYGQGLSVAYFPIGESDEGLAQLVHHEAGGHGFSKLADEYAYEAMGTIGQSEIDNRKQMEPYGWWKNADFTDDPERVKWSHFLADERYQYDGLGCFEGAFTYWKGAWRPTYNSIMRYNYDGFNAPSREAIWYRIHKLAYGDTWSYDYEDFVAYDVKNRKTAGNAATPGQGVLRMAQPTHPPVVVPRRWNEAASASVASFTASHEAYRR